MQHHNNDFKNYKYITYCRKSSEGEDKQVLSLGSQKKELGDIAKNKNLRILKVLAESKSAYKEGREEFIGMLEDIKSGKANAILTYHLTRLARNSKDGGEIIYMMDQGLIKAIMTPERLYTNTTDDKFIMQIHFAMAKKSSDDTSDFVKRDIEAKLRKGEYPCYAPIGYLNIDKEGKIAGKQYTFEKQAALANLDRKLRRLEPDPTEAPAIAKAFELFSTNQYTLDSLREETAKLGLVARRSKKKLSKQTMDRVLKNPMYYGAIRWTERLFEPHELPEEYRHFPIISKELFDRCQEVLGVRNRPIKRKNHYVYSNYIVSALSGGIISGTVNKGKKYYRACAEKGVPYIPEDELDKQVLEEFERLTVDEDFVKLAIDELNKANDKEVEGINKAKQIHERRLKETDTKLDNLMKMKISPANSDGDLLNDEDFVRLRKELLQEKSEIQQRIKSNDSGKELWYDSCIEYFNLVCNLKDKYLELSPQDKREVFQFFYSNPVWKDGKLVNGEEKRNNLIITLKQEVEATRTANIGSMYEKTAYVDAVRSVVRTGRDSNSQLPP